MNLVLFFTYKTSINDWIKNGIFSREINLYKELVKKGSNVTLVSYDYKNYKDDLEPHGIKHLPIFDSDKSKRNNIQIIFQSIKFLFKNKQFFKNIDVIKTNQMLGSWLGLLTKLIYKKPLFIRTGYDLLEFSIKNKKNFLKKILYYFLTGFCILYSDLYTVTSKSDNDLLRRRFFAKNIEIRPNWIKIENEVKTVNKKHNTILSVGRLEHQKNYKSVISSISNSKYIYDIFGQGSLKKNLVKFANNNNVKLNIYQPVDNEELLEVYKSYKFFLIPSYFEGNPKSMLEAMSRGCIVIASDIPNHREIIEDTKNGFLFDFESGNLIELLERLESNEVNLKEVSTNSYRYILKNNSFENYLSKEITDLNKLLGKK